MIRKSLQRSETGRHYILTYHSIGEDDYSIPAHVFESQMRYLAENARVVPLDELLGLHILPYDCATCAITFDDGYASVHEYALPILRRYRLSASLYVTTGIVGDRERQMSDSDPGLLPSLPMLTWPEIRDLQRGGFKLGTHLVHHLDLTALNREEAVAELKSSRNAVEQHTDTECVDFAYPWGYASKSCAEFLRDTGYRRAVTSTHRSVWADCDPMFIPRVSIRREYSLAHIGAILSGDWDYLGFYQQVRDVLLIRRLQCAKGAVASS
jgi:peptidoglycan/xylan/chitin deacetylase (PgdA/CDA1 family)